MYILIEKKSFFIKNYTTFVELKINYMLTHGTGITFYLDV